MLESVAVKLGDPPAPTPASSRAEQFDIKHSAKKSISFNRLQGILGALQPRTGPRHDGDVRVTPSGGLTASSNTVESNYAGDYFREIFEKVRKIAVHQFNTRDAKGITGFIFQGPPGMGKTTMARALARDLSLEFIYVDSSTVARSKYGESEKQVTKAFEEAKRKASLVLLDDAEAMFPSRDSTRSEEFYSGQNNVLFHVLDKVDTSRVIVILTTNKPEQLDPALRDRLYPIEFPQLDLRTIGEIAVLKCRQRGISPDKVLEKIRESPKSVTSVRYLEKLVMEEYIKAIEANTAGQAPSRGGVR